MKVTVQNGALRGKLTVPSSKSDAHRALICAALSEASTLLIMDGGNEDIDATANCLEKMGAKIEKSAKGIKVSPMTDRAKAPNLDCGESGSTLRFLLPVAAATVEGARFSGRGRLPERPIGDILDALEENGCHISGLGLPLSVSGGLMAGEYKISGNVSSQFVSGLLIALPLLDGESRISLTSPLESAAYVDMTVNTLKRFGVKSSARGADYTVPGNQTFRSPGEYQVEGDWSGAAFFLAAGAIGGAVEVLGLGEYSAQPDKGILGFLKEMPDAVDVSGFPDLFPILAVLACAKRGDTLLQGAARLRIKESDRIAETARLVRDLGGSAEEGVDTLLIKGTGILCGGETQSAGDHRIAMSAAIAAGICQNPVTIHGAEAVNKSYPAFWDEIKKLTTGKGDA